LTPIKSEVVNAPYVKEFPLILECKVLHIFELGLHTQFVGEIIDLKCEEALLGKSGAPDPAKVKPVVFAPGDSKYYGLGESIGGAYTIGKELIS
jgi:flavin reductase (DIM6/NTAB) family NADH-FMN oxidoreductase RutF